MFQSLVTRGRQSAGSVATLRLLYISYITHLFIHENSIVMSPYKSLDWLNNSAAFSGRVS